MNRASLDRPAAEYALIAVAFAPLLLGTANEIQQVDPAQYAEVARRVVQSGQLANMHDAFGPYRDKPPITFWLIALCYRLFGETSFSVRLPSLVLGAALLWATWRIGAELWDRRTGRISAALLGASVAFQLMVADPKIDMIVTAWMAWTVYFLLLGRRKGWAMYLGWFFAALGVLTKGPIGLVAPALGVLPEALRRRWGDAEGDRGLWSRLSRFKPFTGPLLLLALVVPWLLQNQREFGTESGPMFLLWEQSFGRLFIRSYRNDTTPLFFLHTALWAFLPFVPVLLFELGRRFLAWKRAGFRLPPDETRIVLWWLFLPLIGISASSYKLPQYLYWLAPPAALIAGRAITRWVESGGERPVKVLGLLQRGLTLLVFLLIAVVLWFAFPPTVPARVLWLFAVAAINGGGWALARRMAPDAQLAALCVFTLAGFHVFFQAHLHPSLLGFQPDREFGELAREVDPQGQVLPFVRAGTTNAAAFYARRDITEVDPPALQGLVKEGKSRVAVVAKEALPEVEAAGLTVQPLLELPSYPTSRPRGSFLNARTRSQVVQQLVLVQVAPR